jgi:hypothetical protein
MYPRFSRFLVAFFYLATVNTTHLVATQMIQVSQRRRPLFSSHVTTIMTYSFV